MSSNQIHRLTARRLWYPRWQAVDAEILASVVVLGAVLEGIPGILDIAVFGGGLHLKVENPETAIPQIRRELERAGISVITLEPIQPSMEDVFVSLIEKEEKEKEGQAA